MVDREWMYTGWTGSGRMNDEFVTETANFLELAFSRAKGDYALCPCAKCMNTRKQKKDEMTRHLCLYGFVSNYTVWTHHGEHERARAEVLRQRTDDIEGPGVGDMIDDYHDAHFPEDEGEYPEETARAFLDMLDSVKKPLHQHTRMSQLDAISKILAIKSQYG